MQFSECVHTFSMDTELRNDRIPRNPFDRQFLDMTSHSGEYNGATGVCTSRDQTGGSGTATRANKAAASYHPGYLNQIESGVVYDGGRRGRHDDVMGGMLSWFLRLS